MLHVSKTIKLIRRLGVFIHKYYCVSSRSPKSTSLRENTHVDISIVKIGQPWRPARVLKIQKEQKNKRKSQTVTFHACAVLPDHPRISIAPILGIWVEVADIVTHPKSRNDRFRDFSFTVGRKSQFSYTLSIGLYNMLGLPPNLWLFNEWRSDCGENQRYSCTVLPTSASPARVWRRTSRHPDSDETMLGRGTVWKTFVCRSRQSLQNHKQREVSIFPFVQHQYQYQYQYHKNL